MSTTTTTMKIRKITVTFSTNANDDVVGRIAADMTAQLETLTDGSLDEDCNSENLSYELISVIKLPLPEVVSSTMSDNLREEVIEFLVDERVSCLFGDGVELDYARDGVTIKSLEEMSDKELYEELVSYGNEDLEARVKIELDIDEELSKE